MSLKHPEERKHLHFPKQRLYKNLPGRHYLYRPRQFRAHSVKACEATNGWILKSTKKFLYRYDLV